MPSSKEKEKSTSSTKDKNDSKEREPRTVRTRDSEKRSKDLTTKAKSSDTASASKDGDDLKSMLQTINGNIKYLAETQGQMRENMEEMQIRMTRLEQPEEIEGPEPIDEEYYETPYEAMPGMSLEDYDEQSMNENDELKDEDSDSEQDDEINILPCSRFDNLANYMKTEKVSADVDSRLATHINTAFRNGISEKALNEELCARPENCTSLKPVRVNQTIWDSVSKIGRIKDLKIVEAQTNLSKSAAITAKVVQALAEMENNLKSKGI